jgi:nucleotide-binding universal stress UspA family protein
MKTILVPIDFSSASHYAADYAAMLAKQLSTDLFLLHVFSESVPLMDPGFSGADLVIGFKEYPTMMQSEIKRLTEQFGVRVQGDIIGGFKGDSIKDMAEQLGAGLICVGRKAGKYKPLFGSTILKAIHKSFIPVIVVPEGTVYRPIKHIVLAVDFMEMIRYNCVAPLIDIVKTTGASLCVLHVEKGGGVFPPEHVPEKLQLANIMSSVSYLFEDLKNENVEEGILKYINNHPSNLLAMIPHHHSALTRIFRDLHTEPIVFASSIPLLILKNESVLS